MILASHGIIGSSIVQFAFDADYQAVLDYGTTQGYTLPSASQQLLQNQLVVDLKDGGIWDKLDTFAVFATDGDSDFALIDWINLSDYTAYNSPTFTTNQGFTGNGSSAYIDSNFNAFTNGINYSLNSASIGGFMRIYSASSGSSDGIIYADDGSTRAWLRYTSTRTYLNNLLFQLHSSVVYGDNKFSSYVRTSSSNIGVYVDGGFTQNVTINSVAIPNTSFLTLRGENNFGNSQISMIYAGGNLSSEQSDFYTAFYTNYILNL
jgi:hypothetical protein